MTVRQKLFHPATAIALLALVVAAGGTGWAATLVGTAQLRAGAVTKAKLARNSVTTVKIASGAVTAPKLARNAVRGPAIVDGAVTRGKLGPLAVDTFALNLGAVRTDQLGDGAVTTAKLADGAVTTPKLGDASVTGAKVAANAITADKIADGQVVEGRGAPLAARVELATGTANAPILAVTGLGTITATCTGGAASLAFVNGAGTDINLQITGVTNGVTDEALVARLNPANGGSASTVNGGTGGIQSLTFQASYADAAGAVHVATVEASTGAAATSCIVTAQGFTTG
jgi:hypothetical protein